MVGLPGETPRRKMKVKRCQQMKETIGHGSA